MTFWQLRLPKRGQQDAKKKKGKKEQEEKKLFAVRRYHTFEENFLVLFRLFRCRAKNERAKSKLSLKRLGLYHNTFA